MITVKELNKKVQPAALHGAKVPHGVSNPVIRKEEGKYYIAYFVYTYERSNMASNMYPRPSEWILADIKTGDVVSVYECNEKDFSEQKFNRMYSLTDKNVKKPNEDYFTVMDNLFDTVRASIVFGNQMDMASYSAYLRDLLAITPEEYKIFYKELSI